MKQFRSWDDDEVQTLGRLVLPKDLSNQSFSSIPARRASQPLRRHDAHAADPTGPAQKGNRQIPAGCSEALLEDTLELRAAPNPLGQPEGCPQAHVLQSMCARPMCEGAAPCLVDAKPLSALGATPFEDQPALLGAHPDAKPMGPAAAPTVGLKGAFHGCLNSLAPVVQRNHSEKHTILAKPSEQCQ